MQVRDFHTNIYLINSTVIVHRLFHWSSMIVPPANTVDELKQAICAPSALSYRYAGMSGDQLLKAQVNIFDT